MQHHVDTITARIFGKTSLTEVDTADIETFIRQYPYAGIGQILLVKKKMLSGDDVQVAAEKASLYLPDPLWINYILQIESTAPRPTLNKIDEAEPMPVIPVDQKLAHSTDSTDTLTAPSPLNIPVASPSPSAMGTPEESKQTGLREDELVFDPYHTIDYFASQGINLKKEDLESDRFGKQLKSFTEWLKSMKKVGPPPANVEKENAPSFPDIEHKAVASVQNEEIITEAMAEVWLKQGNKQKALEIYRKLSLQNPSKNGYFAAKIAQLNA